VNNLSSIVWAIVAVLIVGGIIAVAIIFGLDGLAQSQASFVYQQGLARAVIIEAQGQSRLDSATAAAILSGALLPWMILFLISAFLIAAGMVITNRDNARRSAPPSKEITERTIYFLPGPEWEIMSAREIQRAQRSRSEIAR